MSVVYFEKVCSKCGKKKPSYAFRQRTDHVSTLRPECKECKNKRERERYRVEATGRKSSIMTGNRQRRYGISPQELVAMFAFQKYKCACCGDDLPEITRHVHIDHDHKTNRVRGIVCKDCNLTLGYGRDDPARLRMAAAYLERHAEQEQIHEE